MTEDDAKTKWCPFARVVENGTAVPAHNRVQQKTGEEVRAPIAGLCIASNCMAWRSNKVMIDRATNEPAIVGVQAKGQLEERWASTGFCGLAGAPQ